MTRWLMTWYPALSFTSCLLNILPNKVNCHVLGTASWRLILLYLPTSYLGIKVTPIFSESLGMILYLSTVRLCPASEWTTWRLGRHMLHYLLERLMRVYLRSFSQGYCEYVVITASSRTQLKLMKLFLSFYQAIKLAIAHQALQKHSFPSLYACDLIVLWMTGVRSQPKGWVCHWS